jgi:hypothetical protein
MVYGTSQRPSTRLIAKGPPCLVAVALAVLGVLVLAGSAHADGWSHRYHASHTGRRGPASYGGGRHAPGHVRGRGQAGQAGGPGPTVRVVPGLAPHPAGPRPVADPTGAPADEPRPPLGVVAAQVVQQAGSETPAPAEPPAAEPPAPAVEEPPTVESPASGTETTPAESPAPVAEEPPVAGSQTPATEEPPQGESQAPPAEEAPAEGSVPVTEESPQAEPPAPVVEEPPVEEPPVAEPPAPPVEEPPVAEVPPPVTEEHPVAEPEPREPEPRSPVAKETPEAESPAPAAKEAPEGSSPVGATPNAAMVAGGAGEVAGEVPSVPMDAVVGVSTFDGPGEAPVTAEVGAAFVGAPARRAVAQLVGRLSCELSALGGPTTESCTAGLGNQRLLSGAPMDLATIVTSFAAATEATRGGGGHGGSAIGSSPVNPAPGPAPSGASGSAAGACGIALSGVPTLASLPLSGTPCATRLLRLSCQSWRTACFRLIPERPG